MKKIRVFGNTMITVSTVISVEDDVNLTHDEIVAKAKKKFGGIQAFCGNGGDDKLIGVTGEDTIAADEPIVFDDFMFE